MACAIAGRSEILSDSNNLKPGDYVRVDNLKFRIMSKPAETSGNYPFEYVATIVGYWAKGRYFKRK